MDWTRPRVRILKRALDKGCVSGKGGNRKAVEALVRGGYLFYRDRTYQPTEKARALDKIPPA